jgi:hypothetical protein
VPSEKKKKVAPSQVEGFEEEFCVTSQFSGYASIYVKTT